MLCHNDDNNDDYIWSGILMNVLLMAAAAIHQCHYNHRLRIRQYNAISLSVRPYLLLLFRVGAAVFCLSLAIQSFAYYNWNGVYIVAQKKWIIHNSGGKKIVCTFSVCPN